MSDEWSLLCDKNDNVKPGCNEEFERKIFQGISIEQIKEIDFNVLLGCNKKVGIRCPKCLDYQTQYRLIATRSVIVVII